MWQLFHRTQAVSLNSDSTCDLAFGEKCRYYPALSPDGRHIAWVDDTHAVHVHDGTTGKLVRTLRSEKKLPQEGCNDADLVFSPDGEHLIVTTYQHDIFKRPKDEEWVTLPTRVFHVASGKEVSRFYTNPETTNKSLSLSCAAASPDGRLLAVAEKESGGFAHQIPICW